MCWNRIWDTARVFTLAFLCAASICLNAQNGHARAIKVRVPAAYPDLALRFHLAGVVKLEVVVAPNGRVKDSKVLGGNPVLARAAQEAVKKWEFEAEKEQTTELVAISFQP